MHANPLRSRLQKNSIISSLNVPCVQTILIGNLLCQTSQVLTVFCLMNMPYLLFKLPSLQINEMNALAGAGLDKICGQLPAVFLGLPCHLVYVSPDKETCELPLKKTTLPDSWRHVCIGTCAVSLLKAHSLVSYCL